MELLRQHLLTVLIFLPLLGAAAMLFLPNLRAVRAAALGTTGVSFLLSLLLLVPGLYDHSRPGTYAYESLGGVIQMVRAADWIPSIHAQYLVGIDGLSLPLVILSTFVFVLATAASWNQTKQPRGYFALLLLLETGVLGSFLSLDFLLFFVFFEISLLPMYFLIGIWGSSRREYAAIKFFLYTFVGSIAILVALVAIGLRAGSFDLIELPLLLKAYAGTPWAMTMFVLLLIGFLIKLPAIPLHTWLPDAHVEAPTPVSMILAAVLLKLGGYGLLRIAWPLFPAEALRLWPLVSTVAIVTILGGALAALGQTDFKRLVAYSSVSHMGMVLLGIAMSTSMSVGGAIFMMVAHGVTSAALFFVVGVVYDRLHHRDLARMGGLAGSMPLYTRLATLLMFASLGLPGLANFVGEILVLLGTFGATHGSPVAGRYSAGGIYTVGVLAAFGLVLTAGYMLLAMQRVFLGERKESQPALVDLDHRESLVLWPLVIVTVALGIVPWATVLMFIDTTVTALLKVLS